MPLATAADIRPLDAAFRTTDWRAWHVFVHHPDALDRLLVEGVAAEVRQLQGAGAEPDWFFLRYWENGPHARVRFRALPDADFAAIGARLATLAAAAAATAPETATAYPEGMPVDGWHGSANAAPWFPQGSAIEIAYEPEYRRYGGPAALRLAERIFGLSSKLALAVTAQTLGNRPARETIALRLTAAAMSTVTGTADEIAEFTRMMAGQWSRFVNDRESVDRTIEAAFTASRDQSRETLRAAMGEISFLGVALKWRELLVRYVGTLNNLAHQGHIMSPLTGTAALDSASVRQAITGIVFSQVHMMNNRLGVTPTQEYMIARILEKSLADL